jgi:hypothetical protein
MTTIHKDSSNDTTNRSRYTIGDAVEHAKVIAKTDTQGRMPSNDERGTRERQPRNDDHDSRTPQHDEEHIQRGQQRRRDSDSQPRQQQSEDHDRRKPRNERESTHRNNGHDGKTTIHRKCSNDGKATIHNDGSNHRTNTSRYTIGDAIDHAEVRAKYKLKLGGRFSGNEYGRGRQYLACLVYPRTDPMRDPTMAS